MNPTGVTTAVSSGRVENKRRFGRHLRELRAKAGLTQVDVGARTHTGQPAVSAWEAGRAIPSLGTLLVLASLYAVNDLEAFLALAAADELEAVGATVGAAS